MHKKIYEEFERICAERKVKGKVLEIGATPDDESLLCLDALKHATEKIGVNIMEPASYKDFTILQVNANNMDCFADETFDAVLCNAVLEHDKYFWKTVSEIHRVTKTGGVIVIGTPGYTRYGSERKFKSFIHKISGAKNLNKNKYLNSLVTATLTYEIHNAPGDYYRFSPQTYKEVFLEGCHDIKIQSVMLPPRIIGSGVKSN